MNMQTIRILVFSILLAGVGMASDVSAASSGRIKLVASIAPLADFARQVGGERAEVILLLPPGASPHTYEPSPRLMGKLSGARLYIRIGAGLEFWADRLIHAAAPGITVLSATDGVDLIRGDGNIRNVDSHPDPHVWLDPVICKGIVQRISDILSSLDARNGEYYRRNAAAFIASLSDLDREIASRVRSFRTREYVTFHPAWSYFSRRYGLRVAGVIEEGPGREPSQRHLLRIVKELKKMKSPVVFAEPQFSPKMAEVIAREAGGQVLFLDPVGGQNGRETYLEMMQYNLSVMESVMR